MPVGLIVPVISLVGPLIVTGIKKLLGTDNLADSPRKVVNSFLPLGVGLLAAIINCKAGCVGDACAGSAAWYTCALTGLAAGAGASYVRDFDKNVLGIGDGLARIFGKK